MMKSISLALLSLLASHVAASPVAVAETLIEKRQGFLGGIVGGLLNSGYGKVPDVPGAVDRRVELPNRTPQVAAAKTVKIRYGPYKVPNMGRKSAMGESGTLFNYPHVDVDRPCTGECILLGISAGLEYANGTDANTANGMWLHHMVAFTVGENRMDPTCVGKTSLPHMVIGSDAAHSERFFSSGNERSQARFNPPWVKDSIMGYYVLPTDKFSFIVDLMNQNMEDKTVYMTMTYDFVDGRPAGIDNVKAIWLDAAQCGTSEIPPKSQDGAYSVKYGWTANIEGEIMGAGGHVHDGGTHLTLKVDGKEVCDAVATYGTGKGGMGGGPMAAAGGEKKPTASANGNPVEHITSMSACFGDKLGVKRLVKGQKWELEGFYDYAKHPGMKHDNGRQENVMAISIMYIKNPKV